MLTQHKNHPDFERSLWWAGAKNYLALAQFRFRGADLKPSPFKSQASADDVYTWYLLIQWGYCMEELKEMIDAD
jgi:hypothetical protein